MDYSAFIHQEHKYWVSVGNMHISFTKELVEHNWQAPL